MKEKKYSIGVDIGHSKVCAVIGSLDNSGISILDYAEATYDKDYDTLVNGAFRNGDNVAKSVSSVLKQIGEKNKMDIHAINVNLSQPDISVKKFKEVFTNQGNKFTINDDILDNFLMQVEVKNQPTEKSTMLHLLPTDFYLDDFQVQRKLSGNTGNKLASDFHSICISSAKLYDYRNNLKKIKQVQSNGKKEQEIEINSILFSPIADAMSLLSDDDKEHGVIIINMGAELTEVCVYEKKALRYFSVIPLAGNILTKDIANGFNLRDHEAENVKVACCNRLSSEIEINEVLTFKRKDLENIRLLEKNVALAIEWRLKEIIEIIYADLQKANIKTNPTSGIILTGGSSKLPFLQKYIAEKFGCRTIRLGISTRNIDAVGKLQLAHPKYSTAIGLMLSSLERYDSRVSNLSIRNNLKEAILDPDGKKDGFVSSLIKLFRDDNLGQKYNS